MARLSDRERARLPDKAFAYISSKGRRLLPIHDEGHVRAALARFNQVAFESEEARDRAMHRIIEAAHRHGIVPIGFITRRIEDAKRGRDAVRLPEGRVTFLFSDIEDSTPLLTRLGDGYAEVLDAVRRTLRRAVTRSHGREVEVRADEHVAVFRDAAHAVTAAVAAQRAFGRVAWPGGDPVRVRTGAHTGKVRLVGGGYIGLAVNIGARLGSAAHGGQIVVSDDTRTAAIADVPRGTGFSDLGSYRLAGITEPQRLFQVTARDLDDDFPPLRGPAARPE